jgi:hypothetical protein
MRRRRDGWGWDWDLFIVVMVMVMVMYFGRWRIVFGTILDIGYRISQVDVARFLVFFFLASEEAGISRLAL